MFPHLQRSLTAALCWCALGPAPTARPEAPLPTHFAGQPADALIRRLEPGLGFSVELTGASAEDLAGRWDLSSNEKNERVVTDPVTGLTVVRRYRRLAESPFLLIETTFSNGGSRPVEVRKASIGDWTFALRDAQDEGYRKLTYRSDVWYGSTFWTGPDWTRVGKTWHHPGENTPSVRRFTAPRDGRVTITGRVYKLHTDGDGVRLEIRHGRRTVWKAEIEGDDAEGTEPNLELEVRAGDAVRFVVHKRDRIYCDTTHWDPVIAYDDGHRYQASELFSTTTQGHGGWSYEMETDEHLDVGLPRVRRFDAELALDESAVAVGRSVALDDPRALPIVVLSDGSDRTGVVMAVSTRGPWQFRGTLSRDERLRVELAAGQPSAESPPVPLGLKPGESVDLPRVVLGAYRGPWPAGMTQLGRLVDSEKPDPGVEDLVGRVAEAMRRTGAPSGRATDLDLWAMIQAEWRREDQLTETPQSYAKATARHLEKAARLLEDLQGDHGTAFLSEEALELERLGEQAEAIGSGLSERRSLYQRARRLKRRIALANPRMQFGKLLFCKRVPTSYSHLVMQYYGWRARPGGGIFLLEKPGHSLACRDLLDGRLAGGNVLEPRLSYDAKRVVFSFVDCPAGGFDPGRIVNDVDEGFYHVWEVNVDGSNLRQLTDGPYDDLMPTYLPDGGIAFSSTRRRGYARCFGGQFSRRWHVYTLHRMDADGSGPQTLSFHDTNEWFPAVSNTGLLLYARWDYIDRDAVTHQNLWAARPDGTNPFALWGNATASPHCTFQLQPIPGSPKIVFAASAHHSIAGGSIAVVDPTKSNDGHEAITRITPDIPFPEAEGRNIREYYTAPWPLSEKHFLVGYSPTPLVWEPGANEANALGIYVIDAWGNRELIYRDPEIGSTNPCPLVPRSKPPSVPCLLPEETPPIGEMVLADVYRGLPDVPRGTIRELRVVQVFPKTTNLADQPPVGMAREENARAILGTVPVEPDGSARFLVPAGRPVYFQALDRDGFAYQTMRSDTYVQPGEVITCVGCHEHRRSAPVRRTLEVAALGRGPSQIDPGALGGRPFSYVEVVQPVLDEHCTSCHGAEDPDAGLNLTGTPHEGFTRSYVSLLGDVDFWGQGTNPENAAKALVPRFGGRNQVQITPPGGAYGALGSRLMKLLRTGHEDVELSPDDLRRLAAWIDLNAIFYGVNLPEAQARQLAGEVLPMPEIQ
ncbi:MAG: HzsA-related protein [Planctomycetota bacterium]